MWVLVPASHTALFSIHLYVLGTAWGISCVARGSGIQLFLLHSQLLREKWTSISAALLWVSLTGCSVLVLLPFCGRGWGFPWFMARITPAKQLGFLIMSELDFFFLFDIRLRKARRKWLYVLWFDLTRARLSIASFAFKTSVFLSFCLTAEALPLQDHLRSCAWDGESSCPVLFVCCCRCLGFLKSVLLTL